MKFYRNIILLSITCFFGLSAQIKYNRIFSFSQEMKEVREIMKQWEIKSIRELPIAEFLRLKLEKSKKARSLLHQLKHDFNNSTLNAKSSHLKISQIKNLYSNYREVETDLASYNIESSSVEGIKERGFDNKTKSSVEKISTKLSTTTATSELSNEDLMEVPSTISNEIKIGYGLAFPLDNKIQSYDLEFSTAHVLDLAFLRQHEFFFWGGHLGFKSFQNNKIHSVPIYHTIPAGGSNSLLNLALCSGVEYFFNDYVFAETQFSGGIALTKNELSIGSLTLHESSSELYFSFSSGIGLELNNYLNLSLKYQLDGHTHNSTFHRQLFNQFYFQLGTIF
jgi:hypothetical protein